MTNHASNHPSTLLQYLPAIYQEDPFLGQFLLAFEKILLDGSDEISFPEVGVDFPPRGLEETIADLSAYFDPRRAPDEFLPWLANWVAFTLRSDLQPDRQREFIANIIQFYCWRGTKENLRNLLSIFTIGLPTVTEALKSENGDEKPHYFEVTITLDRAPQPVIDRQLQIARALIDLEKPAHTFYNLIPSFPTMQINVHSTVGVDTLLGSKQEE
jgi:phage tail-like protein